ncbi:MAG: sigma-54-dependent Fis family transcriptional regulator [Dehalococcoidia bacterium]|nr:sigma-54-dependent Fis family transcriptional regulator [Dehalococcoidia bacterium]
MEKDKARILVVDDEQSIREIITRKLRSEGYSCVAATDGKDALWKAFMRDFDVVLMDVKMPGLSGMQVLPKMVTDHPDTCVVMITAVCDVDTAVEAMKAGAYDYLTKPFNLDELVLKVDKALEKRKLVREHREYQLRLEQKLKEKTNQVGQRYERVAKATDREHAALARIESGKPGERKES